MSNAVFKKWTDAVRYLNEKINNNRLVAGRNIQLEDTGYGIRISSPAARPENNNCSSMFTVIQTAADKIKIVNGMDENDANCGYVQCNKLAAQAVAATELTITQNCYIFRKSVGSYTTDVLTSVAVTFEILTSFPTYTAGTEYELKSVVTFADSAITAFSDMPLPYRIDITGACDI